MADPKDLDELREQCEKGADCVLGLTFRDGHDRRAAVRLVELLAKRPPCVWLTGASPDVRHQFATFATAVNTKYLGRATVYSESRPPEPNSTEGGSDQCLVYGASEGPAVDVDIVVKLRSSGVRAAPPSAPAHEPSHPTAPQATVLEAIPTRASPLAVETPPTLLDLVKEYRKHKGAGAKTPAAQKLLQDLLVCLSRSPTSSLIDGVKKKTGYQFDCSVPEYPNGYVPPRRHTEEEREADWWGPPDAKWTRDAILKRLNNFAAAGNSIARKIVTKAGDSGQAPGVAEKVGDAILNWRSSVLLMPLPPSGLQDEVTRVLVAAGFEPLSGRLRIAQLWLSESVDVWVDDVDPNGEVNRHSKTLAQLAGYSRDKRLLVDKVDWSGALPGQFVTAWQRAMEGETKGGTCRLVLMGTSLHSASNPKGPPPSYSASYAGPGHPVVPRGALTPYASAMDELPKCCLDVLRQFADVSSSPSRPEHTHPCVKSLITSQVLLLDPEAGPFLNPALDPGGLQRNG